jgi:Mg2+ and Co2+ transporter CorA
MSSSEFHDEYIITFLSQPLPIFNYIQKELLNNDKQLTMKTHLAFNSICNELLIELIQNELENIIEKEDEIKSLDSISQISKSNSSIHSLDTSIDFKDRYGLREKRKINY